MLKNTLCALALLSVAAAGTPAMAADWELAGSWRLNVDCRNFDQINNVTVGRADMDKVVGTTNVNDTYGKIVDGQFDGKNFIFENTYKWEGQTYTEVWKGSLSRNGTYLRGKFTTDHKAAGGCSFRGSKL